MKLLDHLHLREVGGLELLFALYPILMGYQYGSVPLAILVLIIMDIMAFVRMQRFHFSHCKPMRYLAIYVVLHVLLGAAIIQHTSSYYNNAIYYIVVFLSFFMLGPALRYDKLIGSINWVALLVIGGLLYQMPTIWAGGFVQPIKLPFLPEPDTWRLTADVTRPTSFFWEPQSIVSFLLVPLFVAMAERKYIWMSVVALSMLLSTSTTGIVYVFSIIALSLYGSRQKRGSVIIVIVIAIAMYFIMMRSSLFEIGVEKLVNSDISTDSRTAQGWWVCSTMPVSYWIFGAPFENAYSYLMSGVMINENIITYGTNVYMSTFWLVLFNYGVVGLFFYIAPYIYMIKQNKTILPFIFCLLMALFSNPDFIKGAFLFDLTFAYVFINGNTLNYDNSTHRIRIG